MRGGKREGSGRKKGAPTTTVSFRVKTNLSGELKKIVHDWLVETNKNMDWNKKTK